MARTYKRDSRGRFSGGGGGGKPKTSTARGRARSQEASARQAVKAGGGSKATRSLLTAQRARDYYSATGTGTKRSASKPTSASKPAKKAPAKMSKVAPNKAKQNYKAAASKVRELKMYRGGKTDATVKKAQAQVQRMEKTRRASRARVKRS